MARVSTGLVDGAGRVHGWGGINWTNDLGRDKDKRSLLCAIEDAILTRWIVSRMATTIIETGDVDTNYTARVVGT